MGITLPLTGSWKAPDLDGIINLGWLGETEMIKAYSEADALFFPSLFESYGLPLLEAMQIGLPILCSDLPYARWMCQDEAIYFDPLSKESVNQGIIELNRRLSSGWRPNWENALKKFPPSWSEVAREFL